MCPVTSTPNRVRILAKDNFTPPEEWVRRCYNLKRFTEFDTRPLRGTGAPDDLVTRSAILPPAPAPEQQRSDLQQLVGHPCQILVLHPLAPDWAGSETCHCSLRPLRIWGGRAGR